MSRLSDEYEEFIAELIENVKETGRGITQIGYGQGNVLEGISGQKHQIDVSFIDSSFHEPALVLIECKRWKEPVDVSVPKILKYNLLDLTSNDKYPDRGIGIIVTTSRFQSGATTIATHEGIITQVVNHGAPYGFRYENVVQVELENGKCSFRDALTIDAFIPGPCRLKSQIDSASEKRLCLIN